MTGRHSGRLFSAARVACVLLVFVTVLLINIVPERRSVKVSEADGLDSGPAFTGRRGVGGIKTFGFPTKKNEVFVVNPYQPSWTQEMLIGRLEELRKARFDFIRLNVNPGPLLAAEPAELEKLVGQIQFAVDTSVASGEKVLLDIHPSDGGPLWGAHEITSSTSGPGFKRYLETVRRLALVVNRFDPRVVALELFNEPPSPCSWSDRPDWPDQLKIIYRVARRAAPRNTLVLAGACYADIDGLILLDGSSFDSNTMFTVHYYEPFVFTHQGYWGSDAFLKYIAPLPYPAEPSMLASTLSRVRASIMGAPDLTPTERDAEWLKAKRRLVGYFSKPSGAAVVEARFDEVRAWATRYGIAPARILVGEFGVMKDIYGKTGAEPEDRLRWLNDVRRAAENHGFAWSVWALTNTMGIVTGDVDGPLDANVLEALGRHRLTSSPLP